MGGGWISSGL